MVAKTLKKGSDYVVVDADSEAEAHWVAKGFSEGGGEKEAPKKKSTPKSDPVKDDDK